jgi:hypothetical protein
MPREFYLLSALLLFLVTAVALHATLKRADGVEEEVRKLVRVTNLSSLSLSAAWYEPRLRQSERPVNPAYPEMPSLGRMDFVYAQ